MQNPHLDLSFCRRGANAEARACPGAALAVDAYYPEDNHDRPGEWLESAIERARAAGNARLTVLTYSDSVIARARLLVARGCLDPEAVTVRVYVPTPSLLAHQRRSAPAGTLVSMFAGLWVGCRIDRRGRILGWPGGGPLEDLTRELATLAALRS